MGFSGASGSFVISLDGGKIYDNGQYIFGSPQTIDLAGNIASGRSQLFINDSPLKIKNIGSGLYDTFFVDIGSSLGVNADIFLKVPKIPIEVGIPSQFVVASGLPVVIKNESELDFTIYNYQIVFQNNNGTLPNIFSGNIAGNISGLGSGVFTLQDVSNFPSDRSLDFNLYLDTTFGQFVGTYSTQSVSGFSSNVYSINKLGADVALPILFFGNTGLNSFTFSSVPTDRFVAIQVANYNQITKGYESGSVSFEFEAVEPYDGQAYLSEYVTGVAITNTGLYSQCPQPLFTEYFSVSNIFINYESIFSTGCTGVVGLKFSGQDGYGATGNLLLNPNNVVDTLIYGTVMDPVYYFAVSGYNIINGGSGYTGVPDVSLDLSNAGAGCFDYAQVNGNIFPYSAFSGIPQLRAQAAYMTGLTICSQDGNGDYSVSGLLLTNIGSGYSSTFVPKVSFIRSVSDTKSGSGDAQAVIYLNSQSGEYDFVGLWDIQSGVTSTSLSEMGQIPFLTESGMDIINEDGSSYLVMESKEYFGIIPYNGNAQVYFGISLQPSDYTGIMITKLTLTNQDGSSKDFVISGGKYYSKDPYLLINDVNYFVQSNEDLIFLTQGVS